MQHRPSYQVTHQRLIAAICLSAKTKPLSKVTVAEVCRQVHVNRTTFYQHFRDMPGAIEQIKAQLVQQLIEVMPASPAEWFANNAPQQERLIFKKITTLVSHDFELYQIMIRSDASFVPFLKASSQPYVSPVNSPVNDRGLIPTDLLRKLIVNGISDILEYWLLEVPTLTPTQVTEMMMLTRHKSPRELALDSIP